MTNLRLITLGFKFLLNLVLYPLLMVGFIIELIEDRHKFDNPIIVSMIGYLLSGLLLWSLFLICLI